MIRPNRKLIFVISFSLLLFFNNVHLFAGDLSGLKRFYYQIKVPQTNLGCLGAAAKLAQKFSAITGLSVIENGCRSEITFVDNNSAHVLYSLGLTYLATNEVFPYSAFLGAENLNIPHPAVGVFSTYSECLASLPKQLELYENKTSFHVIAGTCLEGTYETYKKTYVLRIDGFSKGLKLNSPNLKLYAHTLNFQGQANENFRAQLEEVFLLEGVFIAWRNESSIYYYNQYPLLINQENLGEFMNINECESQLAEARSIFSLLGSKNIAVGCLQGKYFNSKKVYLEIVRGSAGGRNYTVDTHQYFSQTECLNDKPRIIDGAISAGHKPLGVLYRRESDDKHLLYLYKSLF